MARYYYPLNFNRDELSSSRLQSQDKYSWPSALPANRRVWITHHLELSSTGDRECVDEPMGNQLQRSLTRDQFSEEQSYD